MSRIAHGSARKVLLSEIIKSLNHLGYSAVQWFSWMLDDCMAGFGVKLQTPWEQGQHDKLFELGGLYSKAVSENPYRDILGEIYQELSSSYGKKSFGQYFTPDTVAMMMAQIETSDTPLDGERIVRVFEPAIGSGVMLLAFVRCVLAKRPDKLRTMSFSGIDLDSTCVKMATLQLLANNMLHAGNIGEIAVYQGNTLGDPKDLNLYFHASTPKFIDAEARESKEGRTMGLKTTAQSFSNKEFFHFGAGTAKQGNLFDLLKN